MICFGLVLWHINNWRLFNAKSSLYIHIKYIRFGLVWFSLFYGISTIVGYSMPNTLYTYTLNIYDFVSFGFMAYQQLEIIQFKIHFYKYKLFYFNQISLA